MPNINFPFPDDLHSKMKTKAAANGQTIKGYITCLVRRDLEGVDLTQSIPTEEIQAAYDAALARAEAERSPNELTDLDYQIAMLRSKTDPVNHPKHYTSHPSKHAKEGK